MISQEELWAFNLLNGNIQNIQAELNRVIAARQAFISLLEQKYQAKFNSSTGQFEEVKKE